MRDELRAALIDKFEIGRHPLCLRHADPPAPLRRLEFETPELERVRGWLLEPEAEQPAPAILYVHAHGHDYALGADEVTEGRQGLQGALGPVLAKAGFCVVAIDMPCFGSRSGVAESAAAKAALWRGKSLAGQMLAELSSVLDWLSAEPGTDARRIGVFGLSMGATLAYWLGAVDERLAAVAHLCCFADFERLIAVGSHDRHGQYLTVPGLLEIASNGQIAGLIAPRPQFVGLGALDPLTPPDATKPALQTLRSAYSDAGAEDALRIHGEPRSGHAETPEMRAAVMEFLRSALLQDAYP